MQSNIELGDGLPDIRLTTQCLEALKQAGFEVSIKLLSFVPLYVFFPSKCLKEILTAYKQNK